MSTDSPVVEEVRRRAMEISARFNHDLTKYVAHLKEIEAKYADRVVNQVTIVRAPEDATAKSRS